ncbi:hypothetical protein X943_000241 [Babesia divergens]|uniref:RNA polymerase II subunit B1 CTD phosphatase RPAP2 homolog n=1 Tax=Babesia divergens TaxID=32595 RepID=A0AAD9GCI6_BABDI|nr:hypothetical protein X943_000241 [Babesia divergens]
MSSGGGIPDELSQERLAEGINRLHISKSPERASNSRIFQRFLELLSMQCSNGHRFHCLESAGVCCHPCNVLRRQIATYVDVATLEEICNTRKHGGICGYVYCNKKLPVKSPGHGRSESTFKIDLSTQKIYRRNLYESFCCSACIEKHAEAESIAEKSPMETGVITPRALRNSNPKTIQALLNSLQHLGSCEGNRRSGMLGVSRFECSPSRENLGEQMEDKYVMFNYKPLSEVRTVRFSLPNEDSDSPGSPATTENPTQELIDTNGVLYPREFGLAESQQHSEQQSSLHNANFDYSGLYEQSGRLYDHTALLNSLNPFSKLWYTLSTCVTYKTRAFLRDGIVESGSMEDKTRKWYEAMLPHMPKQLASLAIRPLETLLSTFRIGNNTPNLDDDYLRVMLYLLLHILLCNREHVFAEAEVNCIAADLLDRHMCELESILMKDFSLDVDSIAVINELLTECE